MRHQVSLWRVDVTKGAIHACIFSLSFSKAHLHNNIVIYCMHVPPLYLRIGATTTRLFSWRPCWHERAGEQTGVVTLINKVLLDLMRQSLFREQTCTTAAANFHLNGTETSLASLLQPLLTLLSLSKMAAMNKVARHILSLRSSVSNCSPAGFPVDGAKANVGKSSISLSIFY